MVKPSRARRLGPVTRVRIRRGLDVPIEGPPAQVIDDGPPVTSVGLVAADTRGLRPRLLVSAGDRVRLGDALFTDRRHPRVRWVSPGCGVVRAVHRGPKRTLHSVVVSLDGDDACTFEDEPRDLARLDRDGVVELLLASGLWTALRARPFGGVPDPASEPHSLFVTAMDSNPLAADPAVVIAPHREAFAHGLTALSRLTPGPVFLCRRPGADVPAGDTDGVLVGEFAGPHPAGLPGTHIHHLDPVSPARVVWHIGYQDVIAIGRLFLHGRPWVERVVALGGPVVRRPRLLRTRLGASTEDLVRGELAPIACRIVSGPALSGRRASGWGSYLGCYHSQLTVLPEAGHAGRASESSTFLLHRRRGGWTTALHGRPAPMLPLGVFERVVPLDLLPTPLLRALLVEDATRARDLGALELEEEDLALCTFLCPSKLDYGARLRETLTQLEKRDA